MQFSLLSEIIGYSAELVMPLLVISIFYFLRKKIEHNHRVLFYYAIVCFIIHGIADLMDLRKINNLFLYHCLSLVELIAVSHYILGLITKKNYSFIFFCVSAFYFLFWITNIIFFEPLKTFNGNSAGLSNLIILFLCMYYLLSLSKTEDILHFQKLPSFWVVSAFLIYAALSLLVYISYAYYVATLRNLEGNQLWSIISFATFIKFSFISAGLLCYKRKPSLSRMQLL